MKIRLENFTYKGRYYEYFTCEIFEEMSPEEVFNHIIKILDQK